LMIELAITGMHCGSCSALVQEVLAEQAGVIAVTVDLASGRARLSLEASTVTVEQLCAAVAAVGYGASLAEGRAGP